MKATEKKKPTKKTKPVTFRKPTTGGSLEPGTPSNPGTLLSMSFIELIIRQRQTSVNSRDRWEVGTASGVLEGRLAYYSVTPDGEITLTMFTQDQLPDTNESAVYIPLNQITFVKMLP